MTTSAGSMRSSSLCNHLHSKAVSWARPVFLGNAVLRSRKARLTWQPGWACLKPLKFREQQKKHYKFRKPKCRFQLQLGGIKTFDGWSLPVPCAPCFKLVKCTVQPFLYRSSIIIKNAHSTQSINRAHSHVSTHAQVEVVHEVWFDDPWVISSRNTSKRWWVPSFVRALHIVHWQVPGFTRWSEIPPLLGSTCWLEI